MTGGVTVVSGVSATTAAVAAAIASSAATNRPPGVTDNATLGFTTSSVWQQGGTVYTPAAYCANDSAAWAPVTQSPIGTPADVMGTTLTKFAGGTCSMLKGYTGAAIDVAVTIGGVYQIFTINILATGELDNVSLGAVMAQADAATAVKVLKIYDQTGNGNHATLANAAGIAVSAASATVTTATTLTINSGQTGTIAVGQAVYGNNIPPGITVSAGAGPYTLSSTGAPANPVAIAVYFGITSPPWIDWDPLLGRYVIFSANSATANGTTDKRSLQFPQAMTFTSSQTLGAFAVGTGVLSSDNNNPFLVSIGDSQVGGANWVGIQGASGAYSSNGNISTTQNGVGRVTATTITCQPMVLEFSTTAAPLTTLRVNERSATSGSAIANVALAGGWLFSYGGSAWVPSGMMKLVGLALFNATPSATQLKQMRYGAYARFNIFPQVINQVALVGDSRLSNGGMTDFAFGTCALLPRFIGRNWDVLNLSKSGSSATLHMGDGLVPTVTGTAANLATYKASGLNIAVVLLGVNDFLVNLITPAAALAALKTLIAQINAVGWTPIILAELSTTQATGAANTNLPILRGLIVAAGAAGMGGQVIDLYSYVPITTPGTTAYYPDGLHPSEAVHQIITSVVAAAIPRTS